MKPKHQRLTFIILGLLSIGSAIAIVLTNFNENLVFFYSPSELLEKNISSDEIIRVGGLIKEGSIEKLGTNKTKFILTDLNETVVVTYEGILPALFREGQGMVARGQIKSNGVFQANNLLTKHDEKYMPPEVADSLKKSGKWKGE